MSPKSIFSARKRYATLKHLNIARNIHKTITRFVQEPRRSIRTLAQTNIQSCSTAVKKLFKLFFEKSYSPRWDMLSVSSWVSKTKNSTPCQLISGRGLSIYCQNQCRDYCTPPCLLCQSLGVISSGNKHTVAYQDNNWCCCAPGIRKV